MLFSYTGTVLDMPERYILSDIVREVNLMLIKKTLCCIETTFYLDNKEVSRNNKRKHATNISIGQQLI